MTVSRLHRLFFKKFFLVNFPLPSKLLTVIFERVFYRFGYTFYITLKPIFREKNGTPV